MPCRRQTSAVLSPASCSFSIAMICSSLNRLFICLSFRWADPTTKWRNVRAAGQPNCANGQGFTTSTDHTTHTKEKCLTKHSEKSYMIRSGDVPMVPAPYTILKNTTSKVLCCRFVCNFDRHVYRHVDNRICMLVSAMDPK